MLEPQEMQVLSLGQKDPQEEDTATHSIIAAWRIPWTEEPGGSKEYEGRKQQLMQLSRMKGVCKEHMKWEEQKVFHERGCHRKVRIL